MKEINEIFILQKDNKKCYSIISDNYTKIEDKKNKDITESEVFQVLLKLHTNPPIIVDKIDFEKDYGKREDSKTFDPIHELKKIEFHCDAVLDAKKDFVERNLNFMNDSLARQAYETGYYLALKNISNWIKNLPLQNEV